HFTAVGVFVEVASGEYVHAHDLELGSDDSALISRAFVACDRCGQDFALFEQRSDESVADAVVLHAFPDGKNIGMRGFHVIVDYDSAFDLESGFLPQLDIRANTGSDDN